MKQVLEKPPAFLESSSPLERRNIFLNLGKLMPFVVGYTEFWGSASPRSISLL